MNALRVIFIVGTLVLVCETALSQDPAEDRGTTFVAGTARTDEGLTEGAKYGFFIACGAALLFVGLALGFSVRCLSRATQDMHLIDVALGEETNLQ
jgi:hypothetical protein